MDYKLPDIHTALSNDIIQDKIGCKFILYEDMHKVKSIDELLPSCLILYELAKTGHFCCIFENSEGIQFFDPLGIKLDDELNMCSENRLHRLHHDYTYLTALLAKQDKPVIYNQYKLQAHKTSTCGAWCAVRMKYHLLHCNEFKKCFDGIKNRDEVIRRLFNDL